MNPLLAAALMAAFLAMGLPACAEKPQRIMHERDAPAGEGWDKQLRERTLAQGESDRVSY